MKAVSDGRAHWALVSNPIGLKARDGKTVPVCHFVLPGIVYEPAI
jgi:hypothetical protein